MKNALTYVLLGMLALGLSSCQKIKDLFDVDIDTTIEGDLSFITDQTELKSTEDYGFNASETVNVLNEDLSDYEDLIKDFNTRSIQLEVISIDSAGYNVDGVILRANSVFGISNINNPGYTWTLTSDWPISAGFTLTLDAASYDVIDEILGEYEVPVTFTADGACNKGNIHIVLNYGLDVTVTSSPL